MNGLDRAVLRLRQARRLYQGVAENGGSKGAASKLVHECVDGVLDAYDELAYDPYGVFGASTARGGEAGDANA